MQAEDTKGAGRPSILKKLATGLFAGLVGLAALAATPRPAEAAIWVTGRAIAVTDGAHVTALIGGRQVYLRLAGVDVGPLAGSDEAYRSRLFLSDYVLGKTVRFELESWNPDAYGTVPAYVYLADPQSTFVNVAIIEHGYGVLGYEGPYRYHHALFVGALERARARRVAWWSHAGHYAARPVYHTPQRAWHGPAARPAGPRVWQGGGGGSGSYNRFDRGRQDDERRRREDQQRREQEQRHDHGHGGGGGHHGGHHH